MIKFVNLPCLIQNHHVCKICVADVEFGSIITKIFIIIFNNWLATCPREEMIHTNITNNNLNNVYICIMFEQVCKEY